MTQKFGSFTLSLDFELYWGMRDKVTLDAYRENLLGVWSAVPKILSLFEQYKIHATWATVGFLFLEDEKELRTNFPEILPDYKDKKLSPYVYFEDLKPFELGSDMFRKMHFAKGLIEKIQHVPFQELATHTYSHYYTREPSVLAASFEADLKQAVLIGEKNDVRLNSLVFPRNQIDKESVKRLNNVGIKIYRGNPDHWAYREGETEKSFLQRVYRFIDIYLDLSGAHTTLPRVDEQGVVELKSSMFMRAYSKKFRFLEHMKLRRVKNAMTKAAQKGENFHLWWHPHNFGVNQEENMANLKEVLDHFDVLKEKYSMMSLNMQELGAFYE